MKEKPCSLFESGESSGEVHHFLGLLPDGSLIGVRTYAYRRDDSVLVVPLR